MNLEDLGKLLPPPLRGSLSHIDKVSKSWYEAIVLLMRTSGPHSSAQIYGPIYVGCAGMKVSKLHKLLSLPLICVSTPQLSIYLDYIKWSAKEKGRLNQPKEVTSSSKIYGNHKKPDGHNNPSANTPILGSSLLWLLVYSHQLALCSV